MCADRQDLSDPNRFKFDGDGYYSVGRRDAPDLGRQRRARDSTLLIAERVQSYADVKYRADRMPAVFPVPDGHDQASWLRHEGRRASRRFPAGPDGTASAPPTRSTSSAPKVSHRT